MGKWFENHGLPYIAVYKPWASYGILESFISGGAYDQNREFQFHVYGKRHTSDSSWEFLEIENEQIKTAQKIYMEKKLRETT